MKHEIFDSMKGQLNPSLQAQAELRQALSKPAKARAADSRRWAALAACACLMLTICGAVALQNDAPRQHSYTTVDGVFQPMAEQKHPAYDHGDQESTITDAGVDTPGSELPGGAFVDDPVQGGAEAYEKLMRGLNGQRPDWYGGAYVDSRGLLTVLLVDDKNPGDKTLELQVLDWIESDTVAFTSAKYSLAHLEELSREIATLLDGTGVFASAGINVVENRLDLDISASADDKLLTALAKLDPDDDAIQVQVYTQPVEEMPYQKGPAKLKLGEAPVPGGDVDGDPAGYSQPAHYDLLPLEDDPDALAIEPADPGADLNDLPAETVAPAQSVDLPAFSPANIEPLPLDD